MRQIAACFASLDLHIEIIRPRVMRCGTPSVDNVCNGDIAIIFAPAAKSLAIYRYSDITRTEEVVLSCTSLDSNCARLFGGLLVQYQFNQGGRVRVFALSGELTAEDRRNSEPVPLHHRGGYKFMALLVR